MKQFITTLVLLFLLGFVIYHSYDPKEVPVRTDLTFGMVLSALGGLLILTLLIERLTEIPISISRDVGKKKLEGEIESLKDQPEKLAKKKEELVIYKAETKSIALLIGLSISIIVCAAGIGILKTIVDTTHPDNFSDSYLRGVDILLTSGLLSGGSLPFHDFVNVIQEFFGRARDQLNK